MNNQQICIVRKNDTFFLKVNQDEYPIENQDYVRSLPLMQGADVLYLPGLEFNITDALKAVIKDSSLPPQ